MYVHGETKKSTVSCGVLVGIDIALQNNSKVKQTRGAGMHSHIRALENGLTTGPHIHSN